METRAIILLMNAINNADKYQAYINQELDNSGYIQEVLNYLDKYPEQEEDDQSKNVNEREKRKSYGAFLAEAIANLNKKNAVLAQSIVDKLDAHKKQIESQLTIHRLFNRLQALKSMSMQTLAYENDKFQNYLGRKNKLLEEFKKTKNHLLFLCRERKELFTHFKNIEPDSVNKIIDDINIPDYESKHINENQEEVEQFLKKLQLTNDENIKLLELRRISERITFEDEEEKDSYKYIDINQTKKEQAFSEWLNNLDLNTRAHILDCGQPISSFGEDHLSQRRLNDLRLLAGSLPSFLLEDKSLIKEEKINEENKQWEKSEFKNEINNRLKKGWIERLNITYQDKSHPTSNGPKAQAQVIINRVLNLLRENPNVFQVGITYAANDEQSKALYEMYRLHGKLPDIYGNNQAAVMHELLKLLNDSYQDLVPVIKIMPITTCIQGGGTLSPKPENVMEEIKRIEEFVKEGGVLLGWQNQNTVNNENHPFAIGGGVAQNFSDNLSEYVQTELKRIEQENAMPQSRKNQLNEIGAGQVEQYDKNLQYQRYINALEAKRPVNIEIEALNENLPDSTEIEFPADLSKASYFLAQAASLFSDYRKDNDSILNFNKNDRLTLLKNTIVDVFIAFSPDDSGNHRFLASISEMEDFLQKANIAYNALQGTQSRLIPILEALIYRLATIQQQIKNDLELINQKREKMSKENVASGYPPFSSLIETPHEDDIEDEDIKTEDIDTIYQAHTHTIQIDPPSDKKTTRTTSLALFNDMLLACNTPEETRWVLKQIHEAMTDVKSFLRDAVDTEWEKVKDDAIHYPRPINSELRILQSLYVRQFLQYVLDHEKDNSSNDDVDMTHVDFASTMAKKLLLCKSREDLIDIGKAARGMQAVLRADSLKHTNLLSLLNILSQDEDLFRRENELSSREMNQKEAKERIKAWDIAFVKELTNEKDRQVKHLNEVVSHISFETYFASYGSPFVKLASKIPHDNTPASIARKCAMVYFLAHSPYLEDVELGKRLLSKVTPEFIEEMRRLEPGAYYAQLCLANFKLLGVSIPEEYNYLYTLTDINEFQRIINELKQANLVEPHSLKEENLKQYFQDAKVKISAFTIPVIKPNSHLITETQNSDSDEEKKYLIKSINELDYSEEVTIEIRHLEPAEEPKPDKSTFLQSKLNSLFNEHLTGAQDPAKSISSPSIQASPHIQVVMSMETRFKYLNYLADTKEKIARGEINFNEAYKDGITPIGKRLYEQLRSYGSAKIADMTLEIFIDQLFKTTQPTIMPELNHLCTRGWNFLERQLLANSAKYVKGVTAYTKVTYREDGLIEDDIITENHPLTDFLFINAPLMSQDNPEVDYELVFGTRDTYKELGIGPFEFFEEYFNYDNYKALLEQRILPGLLALNDQHPEGFIFTTPALGCSAFAGLSMYAGIQQKFEQALQELLAEHLSQLKNLKMVVYTGGDKKDDSVSFLGKSNVPFVSTERAIGTAPQHDEELFNTLAKTGRVNAAQIAYLKDNKRCAVVTAIAGNPFAHPMNDYNEGKPNTHEGELAACTNVATVITQRPGQYCVSAEINTEGKVIEKKGKARYKGEYNLICQNVIIYNKAPQVLPSGGITLVKAGNKYRAYLLGKKLKTPEIIHSNEGPTNAQAFREFVQANNASQNATVLTDQKAYWLERDELKSANLNELEFKKRISLVCGYRPTWDKVLKAGTIRVGEIKAVEVQLMKWLADDILQDKNEAQQQQRLCALQEGLYRSRKSDYRLCAFKMEASGLLEPMFSRNFANDPIYQIQLFMTRLMEVETKNTEKKDHLVLALSNLINQYDDTKSDKENLRQSFNTLLISAKESLKSDESAFSLFRAHRLRSFIETTINQQKPLLQAAHSSVTQL